MVEKENQKKYGEFTFSYHHNIENPPWNEKYGFYMVLPTSTRKIMEGSSGMNFHSNL